MKIRFLKLNAAQVWLKYRDEIAASETVSIEMIAPGVYSVAYADQPEPYILSSIVTYARPFEAQSVVKPQPSVRPAKTSK